MTTVISPAVQRFIERLPETSPVAQVIVTPLDRGFELRHGADTHTPAAALKTLRASDLRDLARFNSTGQFRPIKAAPDLRTGWRCVVPDASQLEQALAELYPGFLTDWHAVECGFPPVTHFRPYTARQTGIYRRTTDLTDAEAAVVVRACCTARFCLKRRWWTAKNLAPDEPATKSIIPCLEPCALLLDLARVAAAQQDAKSTPSASATAGAPTTGDMPNLQIAVGDVANPRNPRRIQWEIERRALELANASTRA